jgi:hypothetical protein
VEPTFPYSFNSSKSPEPQIPPCHPRFFPLTLPTTNKSHRPFDKNKLSVTLYLHADGADITRLLCRWVDPYFNPSYSCYGVHELCVRRKGSSLQFRRWSNNRAQSRIWIALFFKTWERKPLISLFSRWRGASWGEKGQE